MADAVEKLGPTNALVETAAGLLKLAALAGLITTAFGFPAVIYRLNAVAVPLAFLSNADALTAGLIPTALLGSVYLGLLVVLQIIKADTLDQRVSAAFAATGALLGLVVILVATLVVWVIAMLAIGATSPLLHIMHLNYRAYHHEIPPADVAAAFQQLPIWPIAILILMFIGARVLVHHAPRMTWPDAVKRWFSPERMAQHFSVCALLAAIVGLVVTALTAVALWVITIVAIREFQLTTLSPLDSLLISLTLGVFGFCSVLVLAPGSRMGLRNLKPAGAAVYLVLVAWYSVRLYPDIPQWLGGGRPAAVVLWAKAEDVPAILTRDKAAWTATEEEGGLVRIEANMLYATTESLVLLGNQLPPSGIVISRHSVTALKGG